MCLKWSLWTCGSCCSCGDVEVTVVVAVEVAASIVVAEVILPYTDILHEMMKHS